MGRKRARLREMATVTAGLHLAGLGALVAFLRRGSPLGDPGERVAWLATFPLPWMLGWGLWMLCALAFLGFALGLRWERPDLPGLRAAVVLAFVGAGVDLACDALHVSLLPLLARRGGETFELLERGLYAGGLVLANGAYTASVALTTRAAYRARLAGSTTLFLGGITVFFGAVLVVAGIVDAPLIAAAATGPAIGGYAFWALVLARDLTASGAPS